MIDLVHGQKEFQNDKILIILDFLILFQSQEISIYGQEKGHNPYNQAQMTIFIQMISTEDQDMEKWISLKICNMEKAILKIWVCFYPPVDI